MRSGHIILICFLASGLHAQVHLSRDLQVSGDPSERRIDGLSDPLDISAAITVDGAVLGGAHWTQATLDVDTLLISLSPPETTLRDGLVIRFKAPTHLFGPLYVRHDMLGPLPLVRRDGLDIVRGQLIMNGIAEVVLAGDHFVLTSSVTSGCPPASLPVNERLCMDINETTGYSIFQGADHCAERGGKLCTWGEYYAGCTILGTALNGRFDNWEWVDDSSNHTHTGVQAGRTTCMSQRAAQPLPAASTRCCYHPR